MAALLIPLLLLLAELGFSGTLYSLDWLPSPPPPHGHVAETVTVFATTTIYDAPAATETVYLQSSQAGDTEAVTFVLVMWSESSATEGALLIKVSLLPPFLSASDQRADVSRF